MPALSHPALPAMVDAVRRASVLCREVQADLVSARAVRKEDKSPVTVADFASQAVISLRLAAEHPDVPLVAEESAGILQRPENRALLADVVARAEKLDRGSGQDEILAAIERGTTRCEGMPRFFTLDPIDGTKGFLRGDHYAIALALVEGGDVSVGVLGCPNLAGLDGAEGALFVAHRRHGAWEMTLESGSEAAERIEVSAEDDPSKIRFCESVEKAHTHGGRSAEVARSLGVVAPPVHIDSQCKYGLVARGDAELYLRIPRSSGYQETIWDHAAGAVIVEEGGGTVTDVVGKPLDFSRGRTLSANSGVVASNGRIHAVVLEALSRAP